MSFKRSLSIDPSPKDKQTTGKQPTGQPNAERETVTLDHLEKYGIKRVSVDYFLIDGFRYTSLEDAVAQAKRAH